MFMEAESSPFLVPVITWAIMLAAFSAIAVMAILKYKERQRKHLEEVDKLKIEFENEILKAALETKEQTLSEVSREIHDNIGQVLSLVKLNLNKLLSDQSNNDRMIETKRLVATAIEDLRNLSRLLNIDFIHIKSLKELLEQQVESIKNTEEYSVELKIQGSEKLLNKNRQIIIFRVFQEIISNIIKHAQATQIWIEVSYLDSFIGLQIIDNGIGFVINEHLENNSNGLRNVKKRIEMVDGKITVSSKLYEGTSVEITMPYGTE
uniref:sensor histidine kinase n=3 Tax=Roseivirga sp. TaxID=1964215 RepID=UPI0040477E3C